MIITSSPFKRFSSTGGTMSSCNNKPSRSSRNKPRDRLGLNSLRSNLKSVVSEREGSQLHLTPPLGNLHGNAFRSPLIIFSAWGRRKKTNSFAASSCRSTGSSTRIAKSASLAKTPHDKRQIRAERGASFSWTVLAPSSRGHHMDERFE